jgi:hypothetical protein
MVDRRGSADPGNDRRECHAGPPNRMAPGRIGRFPACVRVRRGAVHGAPPGRRCGQRVAWRDGARDGTARSGRSGRLWDYRRTDVLGRAQTNGIPMAEQRLRVLDPAIRRRLARANGEPHFRRERKAHLRAAHIWIGRADSAGCAARVQLLPVGIRPSRPRGRLDRTARS